MADCLRTAAHWAASGEFREKRKKREKRKEGKIVNFNKMPLCLAVYSWLLKLPDLLKWQKVAAKIWQLSKRNMPSSKYFNFNAAQ